MWFFFSIVSIGQTIIIIDSEMNNFLLLYKSANVLNIRYLGTGTILSNFIGGVILLLLGETFLIKIVINW